MQADCAQYAQELLSTFAGTTLGEVALKPATGGIFTVELLYQQASLGNAEAAAFEGVMGSNSLSDTNATGSGEVAKLTKSLLWDRKAEGGFPGK